MLERPKPRMGPYERPFWDYVQQGQLRLQTCAACSHTWYPPGPVCPRCLSDHFEWKEMCGRGRVVSWAVFHRQYLPQIPTPYIVASVALDEGPLLIANIDVAKEALKLDFPVRVTFEDVAAADGNWRIYQWTPA
jgi:uncharacterized OB-fold protein